jgi:tRNA-2-methylthio-N6-dimethylallyladenosine synthase
MFLTLSKKKRLRQIIEKQQQHSQIRTEAFLGQTVCVLIEKESKKSKENWSGRTPQNTVTVFPKKEFQVGDFVEVKITHCTSATLIGDAVELSKRV